MGSKEGEFNFPRGVAVSSTGNIIVADSGNNRVQVFGTSLPEVLTTDVEEEKSDDTSYLCIKCKENKIDRQCEYCGVGICNTDYQGHLAFDHGVMP
jgi:hypothetical protein